MTTILSILFSQIASLLLELSKVSEYSLEIKHQQSSPRTCPSCGSDQIVKNGSTHNHKQKYQCNICNRQFIDNPTNISISVETKLFIDRLLLERISLRGIVRVTPILLG
jgi:transposase-like protein